MDAMTIKECYASSVCSKILKFSVLNIIVSFYHGAGDIFQSIIV